MEFTYSMHRMSELKGVRHSIHAGRGRCVPPKFASRRAATATCRAKATPTNRAERPPARMRMGTQIAACGAICRYGATAGAPGPRLVHSRVSHAIHVHMHHTGAGRAPSVSIASKTERQRSSLETRQSADNRFWFCVCLRRRSC